MITIRPATLSDAGDIANLMFELDQFYGAADIEPPRERIPAIRDGLFDTPPTSYALLAWDDSHLIGIAAYSFLWPAAGVSRSLFLKELYVVNDHRQGGVGLRLMRELCRVAVETGCSRVEWATDTDNAGAQRFYASFGQSPDPTKLFYRLDGQALLNMSASLNDPSELT